MEKDLLRAHALSVSELGLENQHGRVARVLLEFTVSPLFPGSAPQEAQLLRLVLDDTVLAGLLQVLQARPPSKTAPPSPPSLQ